MNQGSIHPAYRPDIDGLRALAVLLVVGYHAFPEKIKSGFIGVDVFFVISGYLISTIIFTNLRAETFNIFDFYARRVKRIFPALLTILIASLAFGWLVLLPSEFKQLGKHAAAGAGFISNFILLKEAGYFDSLAETKPLLHLWSLAVEEQFYIVWPALLWLAYKFKQRWLMIIGLVLSLSFVLNLTNINRDPTYTFYSPQTRLWELLIGALVAHANLYSRAPSLIRTHATTFANLASWVGVILLALAMLFITKSRSFPGAWALLPTLATALLIVAGPLAWINRTLLSKPILVWVGLISFPLYLWHWPLLAFQRILTGEVPDSLFRIAAVFASVLLAWATYRWIESPIRQDRRGRPYPLILCVSMLTVAAFGLYTFEREGTNAKNNIDEKIAALKKYSKSFDENELCRQAYPSFQGAYCFKLKPGSPTLQVLGDSHANRLIMGLSLLTRENILQLSHHGCPQFFDLAIFVVSRTDSCAKFNDEALHVAIRTESIKRVLITFRGPLYIGSHGGTAALASNPKQNNVRLVFDTTVRKTFDALLAHHKEIIFVYDNPEINFDIASCVDSRSIDLSNALARSSCAIPRALFEKHHQEYRTLMHSILKDYPTIKVVDSAKSLCDDQYCYALKNNEVLYTDFDHLSLAGSVLIAEEIIKAMGQ